MTRVKRGTVLRRRHKKVLKQAKGYRGARSRWFKMAHQSVMKSGNYAYRHRREKKRDFRQLWIARISAGARSHGLTYSRLIDGLNKAGTKLDRKQLAEIAATDPEAFGVIAQQAQAALA
jgi:large subunit ribosomal protein L20